MENEGVGLVTRGSDTTNAALQLVTGRQFEYLIERVNGVTDFEIVIETFGRKDDTKAIDSAMGEANGNL